MDKITSEDVQGMVTHWLSTPVNGYLGSAYGQTVSKVLQQPQRSGLADAALNKLRADVPVIGALPAGAVNLLAQDEGPDVKRIFINVADQLIDAGTTK
ncbi:hypothetical protein PQR05_29290 [Paraburkholderia sediminicola]|uniref:hypothetical protein n=1 Tax=Paraburkholderia sediminicola TaxID=458836 RepID=UPI0038BA3904